MVNYRLLALDLDETLLTKDKRISVQNKKWIEYAINSGVIVIFATGRGRERITKIQEELGLDTLMVLVNGGEVWGNNSEILERSIISAEDIRKLHHFSENANASYWGYNVESFVGRKEWNEEMFSKEWLKFGIRHSDQNVLQKIREQISEIPTLGITSSGSNNLEIGLNGKSKKTGVEKICDYMELKMEEVMAIGDNYNDLCLLKAAGLGIAMGNAEQVIKEKADAVTDTNERDGVAKAIQKYLF
ncbi:Cof-type HAD-IIB family hydrolase [Gracilibacillus timonensis]|uniref:Cof-type HAD-IIB family hydrolase n=1 Tax=Gracilibacillus timonensis TaxID=1816696 RepID=UPI000825D3DC|nr:Cof-type HAD-IIB family hydrolase [Gracilibacillus timonensis]